MFHIESMMSIISDRKVKRNYCHGVLLQLSRLLARPQSTDTADAANCSRQLLNHINATCWILEQGVGNAPCYVILQEYLNVLNLMLLK
jgi:hypothetical protein